MNSLNTAVASFLKVFAATILTLFLTDLVDAGSFDVLAKWEGWVIAALASSLPIIINWLNPTDPRYGRHAPE